MSGRLTILFDYSSTRSALNQMAYRRPGTDAVANDFNDAEDGDRENGTGHAPHPIPEDQGNDDHDWIEREPPRQQHRCDELSLDDMDPHESGRRHECMKQRIHGE